ncbi:FKBP-type peptidyl-prolyl cis-trans isomerase [Pedobacter nyackensis]|uniref:FKBP-type peptidyl-prolyl cis-trans isomerase n=1 Tax=Pedobacter nyackensis TaxID=475255 RepID=UPI0029302F41|nr:FKBP-type peptidyl-prolyl cis-trans isomerase [Pedobacter nyackensis]
MLKTSVLLAFVLMAVAFFACKKEVPYDSVTQLEIDDEIIAKYLVDSAVTMTKHNSGLYYKIIRPGEGAQVGQTDTIFGNYTMKILKDSVLLSKSVDSTFRFTLPGYFEGWKIGVSLIKVGGSIRLIVPSPLAYQQREVVSPKIAPNSILDITLDIDSVKPKNTND